MSDIAIKVEGLGKKYQIGQTRSGDLRETFGNLFKRNATRRRVNKSANQSDFWALKDISFEIPLGVAVGIIGHNGAGKSTLLKILSRITEPTNGRVEINGRVSSLLEVGTGFHPELTGKENIYLNGTILGMKRREVKTKFDEIVDFSGVEKFLETPIKHYSSGMKVRLAFSVAAHLEPEVLLIDEVLAVGDAEFQKKCMAKMQDITSRNRTVLFVSHNLNAVLSLCDTCYLIDKGKIELMGDPEEVVTAYQTSHLKNSSFRPGEFIKLVQVNSEDLTNELEIRVNIRTNQVVKHPVFGIVIKNHYNEKILGINNIQYRHTIPRIENHAELKCSIPLRNIFPGNYVADVYFGDRNVDLEVIENAMSFKVTNRTNIDFYRMNPMINKLLIEDIKWS